jgi:hypothetical protein
MVDLNTARDRVKEYLLEAERRMNAFGSALPGYKDPHHRLVIVKEYEYDFGWVFCYNTKRYIDTGDTVYAVVGNAPLIVDREDGQLYVTGTAHPLEHYVAEYGKGVKRRAEPIAPPNGALANRMQRTRDDV